MEWNDRFRDDQRRFWLHAEKPDTTRGDFAMRLCASADLFRAQRRAPAESINYVVSHDGFTLRDLVSFNQRHNLANGEHNRDGHGHNLSFNCGIEGPTADAQVNALRGRLQRALLATTLLAQGTPMLCAGDEIGHSQHGNNNPYCQDNETTWIDWAGADRELLAFTANVLRLRRQLQPFANHWYNGTSSHHGQPDLAWFQPDGWPLQGDAWRDPNWHVLGCLIGQPGRSQAPLLLLLVNAEHRDHAFILPGGTWRAVLDTAQADGASHWLGQGTEPCPLGAHSLMLLLGTHTNSIAEP
jgi:glycogen operon protein